MLETKTKTNIITVQKPKGDYEFLNYKELRAKKPELAKELMHAKGKGVWCDDWIYYWPSLTEYAKDQVANGHYVAAAGNPNGLTKQQYMQAEQEDADNPYEQDEAFPKLSDYVNADGTIDYKQLGQDIVLDPDAYYVSSTGKVLATDMEWD